MTDSPVDLRPPRSVSVIVPFHRNLTHLRACLNGIRASIGRLPAGTLCSEVIVAADGAVDDPAAVALEAGAVVLALEGPRGPAIARNRAASAAAGDLLVFVDSDVVVSPDAIGSLAALFRDDPSLAAAFGAYDESPADPGFISQCRNLAHSYIHQRSRRDAKTFWAGLGGVRADAFAAVDGFDERFTRPSVEDIDLGYRLHSFGFRIVLEPQITGKHLKRWTLRSSVVSDICDRGVPWTQLLRRYAVAADDLNITRAYRACVIVAYLVAACIIGASMRPLLLVPAVIGLIGLWLLDRPYYRFFASRRGIMFALAWYPFHVLHHLCNGVSFAAGTTIYLLRRFTGFMVPGALPLDPWPPAAASTPGAKTEYAVGS